MNKHLLRTLVSLGIMALIGIFGTYFFGVGDGDVRARIEHGENSLTSFVSSILERINK